MEFHHNEVRPAAAEPPQHYIEKAAALLADQLAETLATNPDIAFVGLLRHIASSPVALRVVAQRLADEDSA